MKTLSGVMVLLLWAQFGIAQLDGGMSRTLPGFNLVEVRVKTHVYEIKLKSIANVDQALALDNLMLSKQGILSCSTDWSKRLCRLEALKTLEERYIRELVGVAGLEIAKTNQE